MPNAKQHLIAGLAVGAIVNATIQWLDRVDDPSKPFDWGELLVCSFAAGAAALLPDILEPADSPNHRKFFHSLTAAGLVAHAVSGRHTANYSAPTFRILAALGTGYLSHIALDCTTPAAIDLV
jgi:membrane-bound metal-dependent hydrolase YbcI (DUF457 family)